MKLRTSLVRLVVGVVVPLVALAGVLSYLLVEQERESVRRGALDRNRAFMTAVDAEIRGQMQTLQALATTDSLESRDLRRFYRDATRILKSQTDWQNIILLLPSGEQVVNAARPIDARLPPPSETASTLRVARTLKPAVGDLVLRKATKTYGIPVRVPVIQNGELVYILSAAIDPAAFGKLIRAQHYPNGWVSGLVDSTGHFIARVPPRSPADSASKDFNAQVARSSEGWYRGLTVEGMDTFTAHRTSEFSNWSVGLAIPTSEINGSASRAAWFLGLGALATLVLAIGLAYWMGRRIARPIASLALAARSLGQNMMPANLDTQAGISELREVAHALKDASQVIRERHELIQREQAALKAADRAKDEFLAMLGHELRNPLGAITTSAYVLRAAKPGDETALRARDVIERQTKHMTRLIEDLLDLSRVAMGKVSLHREVFDLARRASRVVRTWEATARDYTRTVSLEAAPVWVDADRSRIEQVLSNLLDNADKFSPPGAPVRVIVSRQGEQAVLEVSDEGEGIAPEMLDQVFELFVQAPTGSDRARGGMGVGLALVKRIAEMHGGTVAAASKGLGQGSVFTVRLPAVAKPAQEEQPPDTVAPRSDSRRILVIEDNDDGRHMMVSLLALDGHSVRAARDGASGILEAERWMPDVALVDIGLPDMEGYEVARRIRAADGDGRVKLVALTGYGQATDKQRAAEAGFDLHLTKPIAADALQHFLAALLPQESGSNGPGGP
jgi:signal transduction histidine kinase/ActR/RegA family two-component response regulator